MKETQLQPPPTRCLTETTTEAASRAERLSDQDCNTVAGGRWVNTPNPFDPSGHGRPIWVY